MNSNDKNSVLEKTEIDLTKVKSILFTVCDKEKDKLRPIIDALVKQNNTKPKYVFYATAGTQVYLNSCGLSEVIAVNKISQKKEPSVGTLIKLGYISLVINIPGTNGSVGDSVTDGKEIRNLASLNNVPVVTEIKESIHVLMDMINN